MSARIRATGSPVSRTMLLSVLLLVVLGWALGQCAGRWVPIGTAVDRAAVRAISADRAAPRADVAMPTLSLVVFTDFRCPACRAADPAMEAAVARDGHVRVVFRDLPIFGAESEHAARVAIAAAAQGIYPALHRRLMAERRRLDDAVLRQAVEASGGDWPRTTRALARDADAIDAQLAATHRDAAAIGITGTPGYLAGQIRVVGALDEAEFARLFARGRESMPFE